MDGRDEEGRGGEGSVIRLLLNLHPLDWHSPLFELLGELLHEYPPALDAAVLRCPWKAAFVAGGRREYRTARASCNAYDDDSSTAACQHLCEVCCRADELLRETAKCRMVELLSRNCPSIEP